MADRIDPYAGFNFRVEIDGITRAGFRDCSGLETTQDAGEYREGTDRAPTMRKIPGMVSYGDISLSRGVTGDRELWDWRRNVMAGNHDRRNLSIVLMNDLGEDAIRWNFRSCWPSGWTGPSLDASSDEVVVEELTLVHEGFDVDTW